MDNNFKDIMSIVDNYLTLKKEYKEYNKENLYDIYVIFYNEVSELISIVNKIDIEIFKMHMEGFSEEHSTKEIIHDEEENLIDEIADVILTTARLIKSFKLEEPLLEMIDYKYCRQELREENIKNERLK